MVTDGSRGTPGQPASGQGEPPRSRRAGDRALASSAAAARPGFVVIEFALVITPFTFLAARLLT